MKGPTMFTRVLRLAVLALICAFITPAAGWSADTEETVTPGVDLDAARALVDAQKFDEALPALRQLDQESPNNPDILNLMGFSLRKTGSPVEALDYYNRALSLNPRHLGVNEYLGELYLELKEPEKAKERLGVLREACGDCEEFQELEAKINQYAGG
jgi:predicted Zn-dependent protease